MRAGSSAAGSGLPTGTRTTRRSTTRLSEFAELSGRVGIEVADISGNVDALSAVVREQAQLSIQLSAAAEEIAAGNHQVEAAATQAARGDQGRARGATGSRETVEVSLAQLG